MLAPPERRGRWLVVELGRPHRVLSWAPAGGGAGLSSRVVWREVCDDELAPPVDAPAFLAGALAAEGLGDAVAMMTGRSLNAYVEASRRQGDLEVRCVATVGLYNARRAGDPADVADVGPGTINLLCQVAAALTEEAMIETLAMVTEARTLAILESGVASRRSGLPATGTGTDCVVVAAPDDVPRIAYAGKHTILGELVGAVVLEAVGAGTRAWCAEHPGRTPSSGS